MEFKVSYEDEIPTIGRGRKASEETMALIEAIQKNQSKKVVVFSFENKEACYKAAWRLKAVKGKIVNFKKLSRRGTALYVEKD